VFVPVKPLHAGIYLRVRPESTRLKQLSGAPI